MRLWHGAMIVVIGGAVAWSPRPVVAAVSSAPISAVGTQRHIILEGAENFRDLGGYRTADGRRVRWGKVYRSDQISRLTNADYAKLDSLDIAIVCDLRLAKERSAEETDWRGGEVEIVTSAAAEDFPNPALAALRPATTPAEARRIMRGSYQTIPERYARIYALMFERLASNDRATLVHCTSGKDRTGFGSALLLTALGVPYHVVRQDYRLTEVYADPRVKAMEIRQKAASDPASRSNPFMSLSWPTLVVMMRSDPAYLDAAFASVRARYGSVDGYIHKRLGISDATLAALKARLLEPEAKQ